MDISFITEFNPDIEVIQNGIFENLTFDLNNLLVNTLTYCGDKKFLKICLEESNISSVITTREAYESLMKEGGRIPLKGIALSANPRIEFFSFHNYLYENTDFYKTDIGFSIGDNCRIDKCSSIPDKNIIIGDNVVIEDFVKIYENVIIGDNSIILAGSVIGGEGYQSHYINTDLYKIKHAGGVKIGNNVEIKNNCCIVKHIFRDYTTIGDNSIFDNLSYFAHCVKCGKRCRIAANATVLGSSILGDDVWVGPSATISSAISVGNNVYISLGSVVTKNVLDNERVTGNFAVGHDKFINFIKQIR